MKNDDQTKEDEKETPSESACGDASFSALHLLMTAIARNDTRWLNGVAMRYFIDSSKFEEASVCRERLGGFWKDDEFRIIQEINGRKCIKPLANLQICDKPNSVVDGAKRQPLKSGRVGVKNGRTGTIDIIPVMTGSKKWWQSKTIIGGVVLAAVFVLERFLGFSVDEVGKESLESIAMAIGETVGLILVFVGRIRASKPIKPEIL